MPRNLGRTFALQSAVTAVGFAVAALFLAGDAPTVSNALWNATLVLLVLGLVAAGIGASDE